MSQWIPPAQLIYTNKQKNIFKWWRGRDKIW
jgi:hypothetical protein